MKTNKRFSGVPILREVLRYIRRYRFLLILSLLFAALGVAATLAIPLLVGEAVDCIVGVGKIAWQRLFTLLYVIGGLALLTALCTWLCAVLNNRLTYQVVRDVRQDVFRHLQRLPFSYLDAHPAGDLVSRVVADADAFGDGLLMGFTQLFSGVLTIVGTLVLMAVKEWRIMLLVVALTPLSLFAARFISSRTYGFFRKQTADRGAQTAYLSERISEVRTVKAYGREKETEEGFARLNETLAKSSLKASFFSSLTNPVTRFVNNLVYAAVALSGAALALSSPTFTAGALTSFLSYANQYTKPFNEISGVVTELQNALVCAGRLLELLQVPAKTPDGPEELGDVQGQVAFENVSFSYTPERPLIEDFHLEVRPGMHVAIIGPTGCGKTTLINLLMRFYDVNAGAITVDGKDIRQITRHSLRRNVGMVLQETWLAAGTVRDNIALARPDATDKEVEEAAKAAHAHSFIRRLPQGYDTVLTEGGGGLSTGQKQLLCIARIMLCMPPLLILDEATSSIDTRTEAKIQEAFAHLMGGKTSFIVAHRLSTIRNADVILAMRDGHVVETGTHEELLARGGFYASIYNSQFES